MGSRIIKMDPAQGFCAQGVGRRGDPHRLAPRLPAVDDAHDLRRGHGRGRGAAAVSAVRWGVAGNIALAWVLTLPGSAAIGALAYGVTRIFGTGALGPIVVSLMVIGLIAATLGRRAAARPGAHRAGGGAVVIASVDVSGLLELAWVAPLAVLAVAISYSLVRPRRHARERQRRAGHGGAATAYGALGVLAGAGVRRRGRRRRRRHHQRVELPPSRAPRMRGRLRAASRGDGGTCARPAHAVAPRAAWPERRIADTPSDVTRRGSRWSSTGHGTPTAERSSTMRRYAP